jgi:hypothetical protein
MNHTRDEIEAAGFETEFLHEGNITFRYNSPEDVLEHLLKSGAGTAFHDAIDPVSRNRLEERFLEKLAYRSDKDSRYDVVHDYVMCIAQKR